MHFFSKIAVIFLGISLINLWPPAYSQSAKDYLYYVQTFADNLLRHGHDTLGQRSTRMLASVIDTRDMSIPRSGVPATEGTRSHDRAVGGSNLYHDVETLNMLDALSLLTGDAQYTRAAEEYARDFLKYAQNPATGLMGWGEHMYYNFYSDTVMVGDMDKPREDYLYHEFLMETPPWKRLWAIDSPATRRAIEGIRYHFRSPVTQSFLFNRHARWNEVNSSEYRGTQQYQDGGQPWIKHSGAQCYSFSFLHKHTNEPEWQEWAEGSGSLYWRYRNAETNLTISCIDDPRPNSSKASLSGTAMLSYLLLKAWQVNPTQEQLKHRAETLLTAIEKYAWNAEAKAYHRSLNLDGTPFGNDFLPVVSTGYGSSSILPFGRISVYFYKSIGEPRYKTMALKVADMIDKAEWPDDAVINSYGEVIQFFMDMHDMTGDKKYITSARQYADKGIALYWRGNLFARQQGDPYYEAKLNTGSFVAGLLRLHLALNAPEKSTITDWSF